ncbi:MAG: manganese efflux pump MntP family protein [Candidatus Dormibacteraceae bacterium]
MLGLLLVAVSVGLSNFAGAIGIGLSGVDNRTRLRVGIAFGLFEAIMPVIGLLIGESVAGPLGHYGRYAGGALLVATGIYTIWKGRGDSDLESRGPLQARQLIVTAFALSIDNLVVGFALGVYRIPIALAAVVIAAVSVALSLLGLELGSRLGARIESLSEEIGGGILILVGLLIGSGLLR